MEEKLKLLREAAREMLKFGQHDGPCDNVDEETGFREGPCSLHLAASDRRQSNLRALLDNCDG